MTRWFIAISLLAGCPKKDTPVDMTPVWEAVPHLPSPTAGTWGRHVAIPEDEAVRAVIGSRAWDSYLGGAAAGIALAEPEDSISAEEVRDAAWQAGYPYPITRARAWVTEQGSAPPDEVIAWVADLPPDLDLGLVRARSTKSEHWVALAGRTRFDLGVMPRRAKAGDSLDLPALPGGAARIADVDGQLSAIPLDSGASITLDQPGEWLVVVEDEQGLLARFPVWVDVEPPHQALPLEVVKGTADVVAIGLLSQVRELYGEDAYTRDAYLDQAATLLLADPAADLTKTPVATALPEGWSSWHCNTRSVDQCVERIVWEPKNRAALLSSDLAFAGAATKRDESGLSVVVVVAAE
jgi:hypothetical protein